MGCHDWVLSVLADLSQYAEMNNLPKLQGMAENARAVAQVEIAEVRSDHCKAIMRMVLAVAPQTGVVAELGFCPDSYGESRVLSVWDEQA